MANEASDVQVVTTTTTTIITTEENMESQDNPFQPDGELSKEVEMMLKRSTISRTQILINSDGSQVPASPDGVEEPLMAPTKVETVSAAPSTNNSEQSQPNAIGNASENEIKPKENGKVDDSATSPQQVDVKVPADETPKDSATNKGEQQAAPDATKPKKAKGKCCSIM